MSTLLALAAAVVFGTIDYIGGHQSKKYKVIAVSGGAHIVGLSVGILLVLITGSWISPTWGFDGYLLPGVLAGVVGFIGLNAFFAGLSTGKMGVVSAISSLSTIIPVSIALLTGEKPSSLVALGMAIAIIGGFTASGPEIRGGVGVKPILYGVAAALFFGIGVYFITLGSKTSALLTMTAMRIPTVSFVIILALITKSMGGIDGAIIKSLLIVGSGDFIANILLGVASTRGLVSVAVVLAGLYPVVTAIWAYFHSHERLHAIQYFGIIATITGASIISFASA